MPSTPEDVFKAPVVDSHTTCLRLWKNQQASSLTAGSRPCRRHLLPEGEKDLIDSLQFSVSEEEVPPERQQEWSPSLRQEDPEPTQIKEEQEELWTNQEEDQLPGPFDSKDSIFTSPYVKSECNQWDPLHKAILTECPTLSQSKTSKLQTFRVFLKELVAPTVAVEIFGAVEKMVAEYQEENDRLRRLLQFSPEIRLCRIDSLPFFPSEEEVPSEQQQERSPSLGEEDPEPTQIKEEQEELRTNQEEEQDRGVESDIIEFIIPPSCVKSECDQDDPLYSVPQTQTVENGEREFQPGDHKTFYMTHLNCLDFSCELPNNETNASNQSAVTSRDPMGLDRHPPCSHRQNLNRHKLVLTGDKLFNCGDCGKNFNRRYTLKRHKLTHTGEKQFSCGVCRKRFSEKGTLTKHELTHTVEKPFRCGDCGKSFSEKGTLTKHKLTHTREKLYSCDDCGKSFSEKGTLTKHKLTHTRVKLYSCGDCGKSFSQKGTLTQYELTDTGEKHFSCSDCGKSFSKRRNLKQHKLTHTGEKPFSCTDCGKSFSQRGTLTKHKLTHTGEKTFSCADCGKSFMYRHHLKQHELTHTGEKPFRCADCGKSFMYRQHLKQHKLTHKGEIQRNNFAVNGRNRFELI